MRSLRFRPFALATVVLVLLGRSHSITLGADQLTAQSSTNFLLSVAADHENAIYKIGETVTFTIKLLDDGEPVNGAEVQWTISKDGVPPITQGEVKLTDGTASVTGHLNEPGFLLCHASFEAVSNQLTRTALAGAGVEPLQIKPSLPIPADFDEFWAAQKKKLAAIPVNARLSPVESPVSGVEAFDLQADSVGAPVSAYYCRPAGAKPRSRPIILTLHGAGVRSSQLSLAANWSSQGLLAMDLNAHGLPNGKTPAYYASVATNELRMCSLRGRDSRETVYFLGMFLRLVRAIDFLTSQPEWDGRTLVVYGSSQGGAQALTAAGLDSRVTFFAAAVPAMCDNTGVVASRVNPWPKFLANPPDSPDPKVLEAVRYYDAMNFARRISVPGIITVGFIDTTCPPSTVYSAYNALTGPKQIYNDLPSPHAVSPKSYEFIRKAILAHVERMSQQGSSYSK